MDRLQWLERCLKEVVKCAEHTLKRIDAEGVSGNFSCNHDIQKWSERVHRAAYEMWLLSDIEALIKNEEAVTEVIVEEYTESEAQDAGGNE